jgi:hypothetical protein
MFVEEVRQRVKKYILTTLAAVGYSEVDAVLRILKMVCQAPEEEVKQYVVELESEGLISRLQDKLFITEKGVEVLRKVGVDEEIVKNVLERNEIVAQPLILPQHKPSLTRLELTPIDRESLSSLVKLASLSPLKLLVKPPKLVLLDTTELSVKEVENLFSEIVPKLMIFPKPRLKLIELDSSQEVIEPLPISVKPLTIELKPPKLIDMEKSTPLHQLTASVSTGGEERRVGVLELEEEEVCEGDVSSVLEEFFELEEPEDVIGVAGVVYDRPVVIVAIKPKDYEYIDILRHVLRVLYRIAAGGLPQGEYFTPTRPHSVNEVLRVNLEAERTYFESARRDVVKVIEFTQLKSSKSIDFGLLRNRLKEHLVEGLSFTVIYIDEDVADDVVRFVNYYRGEFGAEVIVLRPRRLSQEQLYKLAALSWGYVSVSERPDIREEELGHHQVLVPNPNSIFTLFAERFGRDLRKIYSYAVRKGIAEVVKPSRQGMVRESTDHYLLKVFAAYYFVEKEQVDVRDIAVEEAVCTQVVPDIYVRPRRVAIEIETLYGEGPAWPSKLRETVEKYRQCSEISDIWLILPPLQASVYSKYLVSMAKRLRELKVVEANVKILTVDLGKEVFVPVTRIGKQLKHILGGR